MGCKQPYFYVAFALLLPNTIFENIQAFYAHFFYKSVYDVTDLFGYKSFDHFVLINTRCVAGELSFTRNIADEKYDFAFRLMP